MIKPHLQSLYSFAFNLSTDVPKLFSNSIVNVVPLCEAIDGTALKPGLEFDFRQNKVIGLIKTLGPDVFENDTVPKPQEIKDQLVTSAEVIYATTLDNGASIPVGVWYRPKSFSGEQMLKAIQDSAKTIQICERCLATQTARLNIVTNEMSSCSSSCDECLESKSVCDDCQQKGQTSYLPSLRACVECLANQTCCKKFVVLAVVTDCEECNKQALIHLNTMASNGTLPVELSLLVALPDVVHLGKSLKCSWANWFIDLENAKSNLVLIRTLRDSATPEIRKKLRKLLSLECVRNKDRMAVEPIVRLASKPILDILRCPHSCSREISVLEFKPKRREVIMQDANCP